jgi:hypothetical protein
MLIKPQFILVLLTGEIVNILYFSLLNYPPSTKNTPEIPETQLEKFGNSNIFKILLMHVFIE